MAGNGGSRSRSIGHRTVQSVDASPGWFQVAVADGAVPNFEKPPPMKYSVSSPGLGRFPGGLCVEHDKDRCGKENRPQLVCERPLWLSGRTTIPVHFRPSIQNKSPSPGGTVNDVAVFLVDAAVWGIVSFSVTGLLPGGL